MIACEKKWELKVIPPYKIVVVRTYILKILTHWPPQVSVQFKGRFAPGFKA